MPKPSHHRGLARGKEKGTKEWSNGAPAARSCRHTMSQLGGGVIHKVSGGVHRDVGVLARSTSFELSYVEMESKQMRPKEICDQVGKCAITLPWKVAQSQNVGELENTSS